MSDQFFEANGARLINGFPATAYADLLINAFAGEYPLDPDAPVTGSSEDVILAPDLLTFLNDPSVIVEPLQEDGELIGCSIAVSIEKFTPKRGEAGRRTAYIYFTAIRPDKQGQGKVWGLISSMDSRLLKMGYEYVERDSNRESGYADKIEAYYGAAIVEMGDHEGFSDTAAERFFRIALGHLSLEEQN